jgi:hypothetical protein
MGDDRVLFLGLIGPTSLLGDLLRGTTSRLLSQLRLGDQTLGQVRTNMISGQFASEHLRLGTSLNAFPEQRLSEFTGVLHTLSVLTGHREQKTVLDDLLALQVTLLLRGLVVTTRLAQVEQEGAVLLLDKKYQREEKD